MFSEYIFRQVGSRLLCISLGSSIILVSLTGFVCESSVGVTSVVGHHECVKSTPENISGCSTQGRGVGVNPIRQKYSPKIT